MTFLRRKSFNREITQKELKYFMFDFKKTTNLDKLCLVPMVHKCLSEVPSKPVISNCGTPTEKVSEFWDSELKLVIQESWSYIRTLVILLRS